MEFYPKKILTRIEPRNKLQSKVLTVAHRQNNSPFSCMLTLRGEHFFVTESRAGKMHQEII